MFNRLVLQRFSIARAKPFRPFRCLGSESFPPKDDKKEPGKNDETEQGTADPTTLQNKLTALGDATARGAGQVIFLNSSTSGLAILGSLALGDPYLASLASVGTLSATIAAQQLDSDSRKNGLYGYNGCLVGCAAAVFVPSGALLTTIVASSATPFVANALKPAMGTIPQWTFSFNIVTLTMLLRLGPFQDAQPLPSYEASFWDPITIPLKGVSQIFVVQSSVSGAALIASLALYSPGLAAHTVLGASVGTLTGLSLGANMTEIGMGLWGFNSALTSLGCGVFFKHSPTTVAVSAGGAAATAALFGALKTVFATWHAPCLTLPFCITMSGCYLLHIRGLELARVPHSPEKNE
jgi:urea transporter